MLRMRFAIWLLVEKEGRTKPNLAPAVGFCKCQVCAISYVKALLKLCDNAFLQTKPGQWDAFTVCDTQKTNEFWSL